MRSKFAGDNGISSQLLPHCTIGDTTFEDFLVEAGVVSYASSSRKNNNGHNVGVIDSNVALTQFVSHGLWMPYAQPYFQYPQQNVMGTYVPNKVIAQPMHIGASNPFAESEVATTFPLNVIGNIPYSNKSGIKRSLLENIVDKSAERKHKRMIRNRESALRSRARKQIYTAELEIKVSCLEEENEKLRMEKEFEKMLANAPPSKSKCHHRRVSSASF